MTFTDVGIDLPYGARGGEVQTTCPQCSHDRKKRNVRCLSVNIEKGVWNCHHCGWSGGLAPERAARPAKVYRRPDPRPRIALPQNALDYLHGRGITDDVILRNRLDYARAYFPQLEAHAEAIVFPYFRGGDEINRKYRAATQKLFRMEQGCELVLYGLDDIDPAKPLIWVEGEIDKLSLEVAGYRNVVSVPNGAPQAGAKRAVDLPYLDADWERIAAVGQHVIATDGDTPGRILGDELARRLGPERCARVRWPDGAKDANDVLDKHGADDLAWFVEHAEPFPIEGAFGVGELRDDILHLYENGLERGKATGWTEVDPFYTVRPGELTIVTGIPSSGKSNFIDCLAVNLAAAHGWRFAMFSPENLPLEQHMAAIAEKRSGAPFHRGPSERMTPAELEASLEWVGDHFTWIMPPSEDEWTVEQILDTAGKLCLRYGIRGLVIDPWNELEAFRPAQMSETEYVSHALKRIRVFARQRQIHVWVVVHPAKLYRASDGKYPVPTLYDCSGSAHWRNKADNGLVVWRDLSGADAAEVQIHVQKIRFRQVGRRGMVKLYYEPRCATYRQWPRSWEEDE